MTAFLAWLVLAGQQSPTSLQRGDVSSRDFEVAAEIVEGRPWWTIRCQNAPLEKLLRHVGAEAGMTLEGLEALEEGRVVSADLRRRPFEQALEFVLGSAGLRFELRSDTLVLLADSDQGTSSELFARASSAWSRASRRFPTAPEAAAAALAQGEIAEFEGDTIRAFEAYQGVIDDHPDAVEVAEAYMRSGRLLERLGNWSEASLQFRTIAGLEAGASHHAAARLELARCLTELGDPEDALHVLNSLEASHPADDSTEITARALVRAAALVGRDRPMEALRALADLAGPMDQLARHEALRVRARALEGVGLPAEAGRAWLLFAEEADPASRLQAFENAARLALASDDELAVLFVVRAAEAHGLQSELSRYTREAERRLGQAAIDESHVLDVEERIALGESALDDADFARAIETFEILFLARGALSEPLRARVSVGWARCLDHRSSLDEALGILRSAREAVGSADGRRILDLGAASVLEQHGMFDRAVRAYEGEY